MPFDPTTYPTPVIPAQAPDLSKPTAEALIWVLENWQLSPVSHLRFQFNKVFADPECGTAGCAYGVARTLWGADDWRATTDGNLGKIRRQLIFHDGIDDPRVTAKVVAARMRDGLAGRPIRYLVAGDRG